MGARCLRAGRMPRSVTALAATWCRLPLGEGPAAAWGPGERWGARPAAVGTAALQRLGRGRITASRAARGGLASGGGRGRAAIGGAALRDAASFARGVPRGRGGQDARAPLLRQPKRRAGAALRGARGGPERPGEQWAARPAAVGTAAL